MNKPEVKFPIPQSDIVAKTNETLLYIKLVTQELTEAYFQLRTIQEWCDHDRSINVGSSICSQVQKEFEGKRKCLNKI